MAILTTGNITVASPPTPANASRGAASATAVKPSLPATEPPAVIRALTPPSPAEAAAQLEQVQRAMDRLKQSIKPTLANTLEFEIDESTGKTLVKILDRETNTVVRQIPSEEMLTIARALEHMQGRSGLVTDQA